MNLKSLLLSSDEKTLRILRRVLSDLEIQVEHCAQSEAAIRKITRERFEAIIVDCADAKKASQVLQGARAAPVNKRALMIVLVEAEVGLRGGFEMGAHFVMHKPLASERSKASFRAVRALMKRERRQQIRVPIQVPVLCVGEHSCNAKTLDLCEGGMAIQFKERMAREGSLLFFLELPGPSGNLKLELRGDTAWEGNGKQVGVRFRDVTPQQRAILRKWLNSQLPEPEQDDPPVDCHLTELSLGGCYLKTSSPFPKATRVTLSARDADFHATGIVRIAHPEFGMGVEFLQTTDAQRDQVRQMIDALHRQQRSAQIQVNPDGLDSTAADESSALVSHTDDSLVELFRHQSQIPVEAFLQQMQHR